MSEQGLTLSNGEKQLLRRFFHRQMLPYAGILGAVILGLVILAPVESSGPVEPALDAAVAEGAAATALAAKDARSTLAKAQAEWQQRQRDADSVIAELRTRATEATQDRDAAIERLADLESRLSRSAKRLDAIEDRASRAEARFGNLKSGTSAAPVVHAGNLPENFDAASVLERLYNIENRQQSLEERGGKDEAERNAAVKAVLDRLYELEVRTMSIEQKAAPSAPAAPVP